jgi:hypothetical protein
MITTDEALKAEIDSLQKQLAEQMKRQFLREQEFILTINDLSEKCTRSLLREAELREANEYLRAENVRLKASITRVKVEGTIP